MNAAMLMLFFIRDCNGAISNDMLYYIRECNRASNNGMLFYVREYSPDQGTCCHVAMLSVAVFYVSHLAPEGGMLLYMSAPHRTTLTHNKSKSRSRILGRLRSTVPQILPPLWGAICLDPGSGIALQSPRYAQVDRSIAFTDQYELLIYQLVHRFHQLIKDSCALTPCCATSDRTVIVATNVDL